MDKQSTVALKPLNLEGSARRIREIADYDLHEEIPEQTTITKLKECKEFITTIKEYLNYEQ